MSIEVGVRIHGEFYGKSEISSLSYDEAHQMLGACESAKDCEFVCRVWNNGNKNTLKELTAD